MIREWLTGPGVKLLAKLLPEKQGNACGLTILRPIRAGNIDDAASTGLARRDMTHAESLKATLRHLPNGAGSVFTRVPGTHLARWVVIDDLPYESIPAEHDHLQHRYLLFTASIDGDVDAYLDALWEHGQPELSTIYRHCTGYDAVSNAPTFRAFMREGKVYSTFFFPALQDLTLDRMLRALDSQSRVMHYVAATQGDMAAAQAGKGDAAALRATFNKLVSDIRDAKTPAPGTL